MSEPMVALNAVEGWREKVAGIKPDLICPSCKQASFGQLFYIGVAGFAQECRQCRIKGKTE